MTEEGWYSDPFLLHEDRWFSAGTPTALVRDEGVASQDPRQIPHTPKSPLRSNHPHRSLLTIFAEVGRQKASRTTASTPCGPTSYQDHRILSGATVWHRAKRCWFGVSDSQESTSLPTGVGSWIRIGGGKMSRAGTWCVRKAIWRFTVGATLTAGLTLCRSGWPYLAQGLAGVSTKTTVAAFPVSFPSQSSSRFAVSSAATSVSITGSSFAAVAIQAWIGRTAKLFGLNINWQVLGDRSQ